MRPDPRVLLNLHFLKQNIFFSLFRVFLARLQLSIAIRSALAPPGRSRAAPGAAPGHPGGAL